jgi:PKD repeat protein
MDSHNCIAGTTATVYEISPPQLINIIVSNTSCYGGNDGKIQAQVINGSSPYSFVWTPSGGPDSMATNLSAGTYYLTVVDLYGCEVTTAPIIVNQPTPVVVYANGTDTICVGNSITISASANGGTPGYTYQWNNPAWTTQSQTVNPVQTTTYTVTATDSHGCTSVGPGVVTVYVNPPLNVNLPVDVHICEGQSYSINASGSGGNGGPYIYNWNIGGGNPNIVSPLSTTTYIVTVQDVCNTPPDMDTIVVNVHPIPQVVSPPLSASGCEPLTVVFNNVVNGFGPVTYLWNFDDPSSSSNSSTDSIPTHVYESVGNYNVSLVLTTQYGCNSTITWNSLVSVTPAPVAEFYAYPNVVGVFDANIHFYDQSSDAAFWSWHFGDGGSATVPEPMHQYTYADTFMVILAVRGLNGCVDTVSHPVIIRGEHTFYAPNAFAPDGLSGYFYPKGIGFDRNHYEFTIFDRWGQIIFQTDKYPEGTETIQIQDGGWNGRYKGKGAIVPIGVYTWLVKYKDVNGISHEQVGSVTVVR